MGREGLTTLGDEVDIGTGATLVGRIQAGSHAKIAANAFMIDDIADGGTETGGCGHVHERCGLQRFRLTSLDVADIVRDGFFLREKPLGIARPV